MDTLEQLIGNEGVRVSEEEAKALIAANPSQNVYFGCRLCPFAHRSFWTAKEVGFEMKYVHIDLGSKKPAWYTTAINPLGTVPCMFVEGGKGVFESLNVAEYMNEVSKGGLVPQSAFDKSVMRFVIARFDDSCKGNLYTVLMNQDESKRAELRSTLEAKLTAFDQLYTQYKQSPTKPYLFGDNLSLAEIAIFPFLERFEILLRHYRGIDLFEGGKLPAVAAALAAVRARPAFQQTTAPAEYFITAYKGYAAGTPSGAKPAAPAAVASRCCAAKIQCKAVAVLALAGVVAIAVKHWK